MATLISEARKFRISTILSKQTLTQLPRQARAAVLAAGTLIIFRISGEDSVVICKNFDATPLKTEVIGSEPLRAPVMGILDHLMRRGHNNATISAFITDYLLPLQSVLQVVGNHLHPFEFGSAECHTAHVLEGRRLLNDALYHCMQTGRSDIFVHPQALWVLAGASNDGSSDVLHPHMKRTLLSGASFLGLEASANYLGDPRFLKDQATVAWLLKRHAKRRWWDSIFEYRWVYPGPAFVRMLTALRQTMEVLAREPVLVDTGQYQAKYQIRKYQNMENQIRNELSSLPNYQAKVRILTKEYLIKTYPAPQGLSGKDLAERVSFIKAQMHFLGYVRDYQQVEKEIEKRHAELRRSAGRGDLPPRRRRRRGDEGDDPPPTHG